MNGFPKFDRTKLRFGFKGPNQLDLFVVIREYWLGDDVVHAEVLASSRWPFIWFKLLRPARKRAQQPDYAPVVVRAQLQDIPYYKIGGMEVMRRQAEAQGFTLLFASARDTTPTVLNPFAGATVQFAMDMVSVCADRPLTDGEDNAARTSLEKLLSGGNATVLHVVEAWEQTPVLADLAKALRHTMLPK